jgi:hypothetical protein
MESYSCTNIRIAAMLIGGGRAIGEPALQQSGTMQCSPVRQELGNHIDESYASTIQQKVQLSHDQWGQLQDPCPAEQPTPPPGWPGTQAGHQGMRSG